ncbi:MAG: Nif3-like dinuclear metal center hexameric protein [Candidatus Lokiarchaeota archaeon]|nr:Nif3-like dinuclear metal center hexameric protein [Candidatus Lokiarchaeota archaeon]
MFLQEISSVLSEKFSPKSFKLNSEIYGLQYGQKRINKTIKKILLTIDVSIEALHFAVRNKINLIISHHSLIKDPINTFNQNLINKLTLLTKYPISIFVLNSSFIAAEGGVSETIAEALYLNIEKTFEINNYKGVKVPIGRICTPKHYLKKDQKISLENLLKRIKTNLELTHVLYVGNLKNIINKICIVGGDTPNIKYLRKAQNLECDCYITGKIDYLDAIYGRDTGFNLIEASHYKIEILALKKLSNILSLEFPYVEFLLFESGDPFKISF